MIMIICFLLLSIVVGSQKVTSQNSAVAVSSNTIDPLTDQSIIDEPWISYMIVAPTTISLLGQVMVVASTVDVSFETYLPGHKYSYIKYPKSLRATLLQISNEGYRAFLGAHLSMNKIQGYMKQIPQHVETVKKILLIKGSTKLVRRMLPRSMNNIERIGNTCVSLAEGAKDSFSSVLNLVSEVIEVIKVTQGGYEEARRNGRIELNVTRQVHVDMKREEEERRKQMEEIRDTVRKAQQEYSKALKDIPTGFKALAADLGRALIRIVNVFGQSYASSKGQEFGMAHNARTNSSEAFGNSQIINFASSFSNSLNGLIEALSKTPNETSTNNDNQKSSKSLNRNSKELESYKVAFNSYKNLVNIFPQNNLQSKATDLIQRSIVLVDKAIKDKNIDITSELQIVANEIKPFMAAEQISTNNPSSNYILSTGDSSQNELFKARLAQENLARQEQRIDAYYANHVAAMEQIRQISEKLTRLNIEEVHFTEIIDMLEEAFSLLAELQKNWNDLVLFFSSFANQVVTGFGEKLKTFIGTTSNQLDAEAIETDRTVIMGFLTENSGNLYHESYVLYVLSRTYYDISSVYLMPRLADLNSMLSCKTTDERQTKLVRLRNDISSVEKKVKELIEERKRKFKQVVSERRAQIIEVIDEQGADGNEDEIIEEADALKSY